HEWRRRRLAALHRLDVSAKGTPAGEAVPRREVAPRLGDADTRDGRDAVRAAFVVVEIGAERLLERHALDVRLQLRPAREAELAGELELRVGQLDLVSCGALRAHTLLRPLPQLVEVELKGHSGSLPSRRVSAWAGWRGSSFVLVVEGEGG